MEVAQIKAIMEAMLFATGREISSKEFMGILELNQDEFENIVQLLQMDYKQQERGIELIKVEDRYQLTTKKEYVEYLYPLFDNRSKPNLSNPALETLAIIAYNPRITRAEIEAIRGVNSDGTIYKLLEYNLIEEAGRIEAPGRPNTYQTTSHFLKTFGMTSLEELPELPKYKLDEHEQIVLEEFAPEEKRENTEAIEILENENEKQDKEKEE